MDGSEQSKQSDMCIWLYFSGSWEENLVFIRCNVLTEKIEAGKSPDKRAWSAWTVNSVYGSQENQGEADIFCSL